MALHPAEEATIRAFILPERRPRYLEQLGAPRRRAKFRLRLAHCHDLDRRFATPACDVTAAELRDLGAPEQCHLISESPELDGREMPLSEALAEIHFQYFGTIVCCIPGRLAYYHGEDGQRQYLLVRNA
jgi:hypothetical protein